MTWRTFVEIDRDAAPAPDHAQTAALCLWIETAGWRVRATTRQPYLARVREALPQSLA